MEQVIVFTNEKGSVSVCVPTGELPVEEVLAKDCPEKAIIIDASTLPQGEDANYFDAWELVDGKVVVNLDKKNAIILEKEAPVVAKQSALAKLSALGLTQDEIAALIG